MCLMLSEVSQEQNSSPFPGRASLPSQETENTPQGGVLSSSTSASAACPSLPQATAKFGHPKEKYILEQKFLDFVASCFKSKEQNMPAVPPPLCQRLLQVKLPISYYKNRISTES